MGTLYHACMVSNPALRSPSALPPHSSPFTPLSLYTALRHRSPFTPPGPPSRDRARIAALPCHVTRTSSLLIGASISMCLRHSPRRSDRRLELYRAGARAAGRTDRGAVTGSGPTDSGTGVGVSTGAVPDGVGSGRDRGDFNTGGLPPSLARRRYGRRGGGGTRGRRREGKRHRTAI